MDEELPGSAPEQTASIVPGRWSQLLLLKQPATAKVLIAVVAVGLLFDLAVRSSDIGVATAMLFTGAAIALAVIVGTRRPSVLVPIALVPVFSVWLVVRGSDWLLPLDILAVLVLLCVAASFASGSNPFRLTVPGVVLRAAVLFTHTFLVIPFLTEPIGRLFNGSRSNRWKPILRGIFIAAPAFIVLLVLLMSADAVFASIFRFDLNIDNAIGHVFIVAIGIWLFATLARTALAAQSPEAAPTKKWMGATEGLIGVGSTVLLFAVFVVSQVVVWIGGADRVLETAGLTYADHAREGFFQLLAVAVITLGILMVTRASTRLETDNHRVWFKGLAVSAIALTLVIVAVALRRLALYEDAYGLTMLRLYSTVFAVLIGVVFVLFAVAVIRSSENNWFVGAATSASLAVLFALNVANPEAFVVNRNFDRQASTQAVPFDAYYMTTLSSDAIPTVLDRVDELPDQARDTIRRNLCTPTDDVATSWTEFNLSRDRATSARLAC